MKKVNASHAEFVECADRLRVMSGDVSGDAWAAMQKGAHKLEQAAALLDVFADTIRALQAERDELKSELGAVRPRTEGRMDELISRDALKDALAKRVPFAVVTSDDAAFAYGLDAAYVAVQEAPTIDPVRVTGETSDGYHTFNELYHHRAVLFSVICRSRPELAWKARKHHDGTMYDGMFIVGIETPDGQATYHYDVDPYWEMFRVREFDHAPEWDGHTPAQAIERIGKIDPVRHAHWEAVEVCCNHAKDFRCSGDDGCGGGIDYGYYTRICDYEYCPWCGARMDGEEEKDG